uniref:Uncharacterized protein n=1 Tax=Arundo donax TaxID=35708 RepID=A0A0A9CT89_ARUDO
MEITSFGGYAAPIPLILSLALLARLLLLPFLDSPSNWIFRLIPPKRRIKNTNVEQQPARNFQKAGGYI